MDNVSDKINDLLGGMSEEDMRSLREAAQAMFGAADGADKGSQSKDAEETPPFSGFDPALMMKLSSMMAAMNKKDNRSDLIAALKPHLSKGRQKRADEAMQLLKLLDLLPMIQSSFNSESGGEP